jgi:hypothetical protein
MSIPPPGPPPNLAAASVKVSLSVGCLARMTLVVCTVLSLNTTAIDPWSDASAVIPPFCACPTVLLPPHPAFGVVVGYELVPTHVSKAAVVLNAARAELLS